MAEWIAHSEFAKKLIGGSPTLLVRDGQILKDKMKQVNLNEEELFSKLRLSQIEQLGQVKSAILEPSGELSVIKYSRKHTKVGKSVMLDDPSEG